MILVGVFIAALTVFFLRVGFHTYSNELQTVAASQATLPTVSFSVGGVEINPMVGYTFEPQAQLLRETVTPIRSDLTFVVLIDEHESVVRRLTCRVSEVATGTEIETKEVKALKKGDDGRLSATVMLTGNYANNTEYTCHITLTTGDGRDVQFYTRLMVVTFGNLSREVEFVKDFHSALFDKNRMSEIEAYLDTLDSSTGADYSHVTIEDDVETVTYGQMNPTELYASVPTITEYNSTYVCATMESRLMIYTDDAEEKYCCTEQFRFRSQSRNHILFNYDRKLQADFDGTIVSINRNQIKLGLTTETDFDYLLSGNGKYLLFSYGGNLWEYDMVTNTMIELFTFERNGGDELRYRNKKHDFKLISVDNEGQADFVFYGYITRGQYEGRVGILYYRYYAKEGRIEEMMFVPVTVSYEILKEEFGELCYMNKYDEFYFKLYDTLYLYRTLVHDFSAVSEHLPKNSILFAEEGKLVFQNDYSDAANTQIVYYDLENRKAETETAEGGDRVLLLGAIEGDLIYGLAHEKDVTFHDNGDEHVPMYKIIIRSLDGTVIKEYESGDVYFSSALVEDNAINIELCSKQSEAIVIVDGVRTYRPIYVDAGNYNILKSSRPVSRKITVSGRTGNLMHREYYMNLPSGYKLEKEPKTGDTVFTVLTNNTSVRVGSWIDSRYYVVSYGGIRMVSQQLGRCIALADETTGAVYDGKGNILWKRGTKADTARVKNLTPYYVSDERSELQAILQMFLSYKGSAADAANCDLNAKPMFTWLSENIPGTAVDISGATLAEALTFVSEGRPVAARYNGTWVMIIGYESSRIIVISPTAGKQMSLTLSDAKATIEKASIYYSYID